MTKNRLMIWTRKAGQFLLRFWPQPLASGGKQIVIAAVGAGLGLMLTSLLCHWILGEVNLWFIAPVGASAVLVFGVPASPLAQPWSVIGGNTLAAVVGITVGNLLPHPSVACGVAGAIAMALMHKLRCLHPPGGAVAVTAIFGGPTVHALGYQFVLTPVLLNSVMLVLVGVIFNHLSGRRYPHLPGPVPGPAPVAMPYPISREDLHEALLSGEMLDIDEDDARDLLTRAEQIAARRQAGRAR
ncbi:HPP family protein [Duffyella gerundensis]|uniref:HPP family protein n=1 Tax=Duffyella gerundensis TaxID=1619313 RepID=UPI001F374990|nr:HPP family protein [Duffyella gerundensis]